MMSFRQGKVSCYAIIEVTATVLVAVEGESAMFGLGPLELILILVAILIIFGAGKLPQVLGSLGKGVKEFREASEGTTPTPPPTPDSTNSPASATVNAAQATQATTPQTPPPAANQNASTPPDTKS
jgi:sec-independent protein translocase protein TatA